MKHIAVVEDEALMREELADMLRRAGYAVTEVTDFADVTGQGRSRIPVGGMLCTTGRQR